MGQEDKEEVPAEEFTAEETLETSTPESELEVSESEETTEPEASFEQASSEDPENTIDDTNESSDESQEPTEFKKEDDQEEKEEEDSDDSEDQEKSDEDDEKKKYSLLEQQYNELSTQYEQLKNEYDALVEFKNNVENEKKDALIGEFYMLSEEDKKDVIENKAKYTLDEIKAKLAVICYQKKVNFNSEESEEIDKDIEDKDITTFNFDDSSNNLPDWVRAVKNVQNSI